MNFKIQSINRHRMATDGVGITTLIGLSGCPLDCSYCINLELLHKHPSREYTQEQLFQKVMEDYCYFVASNGGITFGGGEPLLQSVAIQEFCGLLPKEIHVNIETSLYVDGEQLLPLLELIGEFIIDVKSLNPEIYQTYTKREIKPLLENLHRIADGGYQGKCMIRVPRIPDLTTEKDIQDTVEALKELGFTNIQVFDYLIR